MQFSGCKAEAEGRGIERGSDGKRKPETRRISGDNSLRDPPVPIPNTEVKPQHADGTWLATARESRSSPDSILFGQSTRLSFFLFASKEDAEEAETPRKRTQNCGADQTNRDDNDVEQQGNAEV